LIYGTVNSEKYQEILQEFLLPFINEQNSSDIIFQQDNAKPHVSKSTKIGWKIIILKQCTGHHFS
jgi:hypothetical protein